jgi:5-methyltetrahydrofolate--homocysteine methyltransferase
MQAGFELCKEKIPAGSQISRGKVIIATVKGDIHDIGKNIVKMLLENNGFAVLDLGKDVTAQKIVETVKREKAQAVLLSALLTTTMTQMEIVKAELSAAGINIPVIVGGAVVTDEYANQIGAYYGKDAVGAVELAEKVIQAIG